MTADENLAFQDKIELRNEIKTEIKENLVIKRENKSLINMKRCEEWRTEERTLANKEKYLQE